MGRIDDALRRSNVDAARGTGAEAPAPAPSPWQVEEQDTRAAAPGAAGPAGTAAPAAEGATRGARREPPKAGRFVVSGGIDARAAERLVASADASPLLVEQFRTLGATLLRIQGERPLKSLLVTSPSPGDGKSHVATNLALTLSDSYHRRVLLIDADLRRPTLHQVFRLANASGLCEALRADTDEKVPTARVSENLTLLPAGRPEANPLAGLSSGRMARIVADAAAAFDWVIVDSPPVVVLADAHFVSETVDGAIVVVRAGVTRFPDLAAAVDTLGQDRVLGVVLNALDPAEMRSEGYYSYYYGRSGRASSRR